MYFFVLITNMLKYVVLKYLNWLIEKLVNWSKLKLSYEFSFFDIMTYLYVLITDMQKLRNL